MDKDLTTLFTGRHCIVLPEIESTNSYLSVILRHNTLPEGAVIRALKQNAGRGQAGTEWVSESGKNLLLSFVFYPTFISPQDVFILNKSYVVAVRDFVAHWLGKDIFIKWPNDIYRDNKKLCGLLIENSVNSSSISHSILGIGINVNQRDFPQNLANPASFYTVTGKEFNLDELFASLCSFIEARYLQLKNGDTDEIEKNYSDHLYLKNVWITFETTDERIEGRILSVDHNGKLNVETGNGKVKNFDIKEIRYPVK